MYEIDFLPAGEGKRSGDAIALRYTVAGISEPVVGIIDAGSAPCGPALVDHIRHYYETENVDFVLNTHIDSDHTGGLTYVLRKPQRRALPGSPPGSTRIPHGRQRRAGA